jgi:DNA repair exonuclease SbcCD ATPase subunit
MSIHFRTIRWQNFLSTGNQFTEIRLDKSASTLIVGENGAGKSTLLDAISFVLYGKPYRNINKPLLINSITNKNCLVEIEFDVKNKKYLVRRGLKPGIFDIYCDDKIVDQNSSVREYQDLFEKNILGLNYKSFTQIVVIGSANFTPFMQLRAHERREVIEDLLDIEIFTKMYNILKEKISKNKDSITQTKYEIDLLEQRIELTRKHMNEIVSIKNTDKKEKQKFIKSLEVENEKLNDHIKALNSQVKLLNDKISDRSKIEGTIQKLKQYEYKLNHKISVLDNEIEFFHSNDECPTCQQFISEESKLTNVSTKSESKEKVLEGLDELHRQYNTLNERMKDITITQTEISNIQSDIIQYSTKVSANNSQIKQMSDTLSKEVVGDDNSINDLKKYTSALEKRKTEYKDLLDKREQFEIASSLLKDSGIKTKIIKQYIPIINKLMNKYLAAMDFFVQFELDENFNERILSRFRDEFKYDSFSEGEKMRLDLSLLFTWRAVAKLRNSSTTNLLIMDEVFDSSLDSTGTDEFLKIITQLNKDTNVFVISHKGAALFDKFHSAIKFEKVKNFSFISKTPF